MPLPDQLYLISHLLPPNPPLTPHYHHCLEIKRRGSDLYCSHDHLGSTGAQNPSTRSAWNVYKTVNKKIVN